MRLRLVGLLLPVVGLVLGCAARSGPQLPVPPPESGRVVAVARHVDRTGDVQPIAVALTNGRNEPVRLDARQIYALTEDGNRIAPLPPGEAARQAGGARLPGAVKGSAVGAVTGGFFGAIGGLIAGAIQGGLGAAVAVGSAVGAGVGAVAGAIGGGHESPPDVAGFTDRALPSTTLGPGLSTTGYVYYSASRYTALEILLPSERGGGPDELRIPIEPES
ncbi:MAG TPA: hypothetical protein VKA21_14995 [Candidatus Binatia bacterium]|nr:hypothetical protein [Candidatus Binatia bacterium]